LNKHGSTL